MDPIKAATNLRDHGVAFEEATTVFADPLAMLMADPDHSVDEERYVLLGESTSVIFWWSPMLIGHRELG